MLIFCSKYSLYCIGKYACNCNLCISDSSNACKPHRRLEMYPRPHEKHFTRGSGIQSRLQLSTFEYFTRKPTLEFRLEWNHCQQCAILQSPAPSLAIFHSGAERSLSQKKYIIDKTYTVWKVWAISFRNSWRKNPDLAAFWEKRKNVIFLVSELENEGFIRISLEFWLELLTIDYKLKLTFMSPPL